MDEIVIDDKNQKRLQEINDQMRQLGSYMRIIGDTLINNAKVIGEYQFAPDFAKLIKVEKPIPPVKK